MEKLDITTGDGFFIASTSMTTKKKLKIGVSRDKELISYYDFVNREGETIPLQKGSGTYTIELFENLVGNRYTKITSKTIKVLFSREDAAFLHANQYVNYTEKLSNLAIQLRKDKNDEEFYDAVRKYMNRNFSYDFVYAIQVAKKTGVLPDTARLEEKRMGICQDLAAYAVGLLREGGVPAKLVIGQANGSHAWVETEFGIYDPTAELNGMPKPKNYKAERYY